MKKLLLSLALMLSVFSLSAQKFTVTEKETGNVVENGATYYIIDDGSSFWGFGEELFAEFYVIANEDVSIVVEKIENTIVQNSTNYFCSDLCYGANVYVSNPYPLNQGNFFLLSMHYGPDVMHMATYLDILSETLSMTYYLYEEDNPDEKFVININFTYSLYGVDENNIVEEFSSAYPTPAKDVVNFDYNFSSSANEAYVAIYSMTGQEIMRSDINDLQGKVSFNVSDLADGVYFYSLIVNGVVEKSNKLVVRR